MKKHCLTVDLKNDADLIAAYEQQHQEIWPEIILSIRAAGIENMEIYRVESRLFMIMEVNDDFSFEKKQASDESNSKVQEWETLMWKYQQALPFARPGEKWVLMKKIFQL
ncbi:MAG TPA: L-rhamnose mutarotase [Niabella sp.]|nr:L-rhamnose mutarotase [Niabella sp.]